MRSPRSGLILFVQRARRHVAREVIGTSRLVGIVTMTAFGLVEAGRTDQHKIVNLVPRFSEAVVASRAESPEQQVQSFRDIMGVNRTDLYSKTGLGFDSSDQLDQAILKTLANARQHSEAMWTTATLLAKSLPNCIARFKEIFPDFTPSFPIYLVVSLGQLDGAGRIIDGQPSLVLGVDNITAEFSPAVMPIFLDHELFHRYHCQVAGFSDDNGSREIIWRALWAEGLATYVSMSLNPPATLQTALFVPEDLVQRAHPILPSLIAEIAPKLDEVHPQFFAKFFLFHPSTAAMPSRGGYYVGAVVAERLAKQKSIFKLAHLQPQTVRLEIGETLASMVKNETAP